MPSYDELWMLQSLPLEVKIRKTEERIKEWVDYYGLDGVYISFSGGKDSTVLMDIVRNKMKLNIPAVFVDVPTQYPELKQFAMTWDNLTIIKPKMSFVEVCEKYGFPLISKEVSHKMHDWYTAHKNGKESYTDRQFDGTYISKNGKSNALNVTKYSFLREANFKISHYCCNIMKKEPVHKYSRKTKRMGITAQMADESFIRTQKWLQNGCNAFNTNNPVSNPMSFWTEQDILTYIRNYDLPICSVYGKVVEDYEAEGQCEGQLELFGENTDKIYKTTGCKRTGCMLCGFGCHLEKSPNRFELLAQTHPRMLTLLDNCKNNGVTYRQAIEWINENGKNIHINLPD